MLIWLGGFARPVLELSLLFWLLMIGAGLYFGLRFEDVTAADPDPADDRRSDPGSD